MLKDVVICTLVWNRFELARAAFISFLAFRDEVPHIVVLDDASTDHRVRLWFETMEDGDEVMYRRMKKNGGPGLLRQMIAKIAPQLAEYVVWIDSDIVIGPDSLTTMKSFYDHYWDSDTPIGMLSALPIRRSPAEFYEQEWSYLYKWGDIGFMMMHKSMLIKFGHRIKAQHHDETKKFMNAVMDAGYLRAAAINPPIYCAHLGVKDCTVKWFDEEQVKRAESRGPWGVRPKSNPLPDLLDYDKFFAGYPQSAIELGNQIRDVYIDDESLWNKIQEADRKVGLVC